MKKEKLFFVLGIALILCLIAGVFFANHALAEEISAVVYVSENGSSANDGLTEDTPVGNMTEAYNALYAQMQAKGLQNRASAKGQIVLLSDVTLTLNTASVKLATDFGTHAFTVVISSKNGDSALNFAATRQSYYTHIGPTEYRDIALSKTTKFLTLHAAENSALIMGENVKCIKDSTGSDISLVGAPHAAYTGDTHLEVHSGTWGNLYAAGYTTSVTGTANVLMTGGTCAKIGSVYNNALNGDAHITVTGGTVQNIYGGAIATSGANRKVTGSIYLSVSNIKVSGDFSAGGYTTVGKDIVMELKNADIENAISASCSGEVHLSLEASAGKTLRLAGAGTLSAESFVGGGELVLGADTKLDLAKVSGSTHFSVTPAPKNGAGYITAPLDTPDDAFVYTDSSDMKIFRGEKKVWSFFDEAEFKGLKLYAPKDVTVTLYTGFSGGSVVLPDMSLEGNGVQSYYYSSLTAGNYRFTASGKGYYNIVKNLYMTEEKLAGLTAVSADPGKTAGKGYEASNAQIQLLTDEAYENMVPSDPSLWPEYADVFTTPAFTNPHAAHEFTSQDEMMAFLKALDGTSLHAYQYTLAKSSYYGYDLPMIVFTSSDLSGAETWEEAAQIVRANGKTTVQYHAQIHGNEPAAGEGALAMIKALYGSWGDKLIKDVNIYVIPRVNPDGSQAFTRNEVSQNANMNRDMMTAETAEVQALLRANLAFEPDVVIDAHEYTQSSQSTSSSYNDILMSIGGGVNNGASPRELGVEIFNKAISDLALQNLRGFAYPNVETAARNTTVNAVNPTTGRLYNSLSGSLSFLVETRGIYDGRATFERRVAAQFIAIESLLNSVAENAGRVQETVKAEQERIIQLGKTYEESDVISLQSETSLSTDNSLLIRRPSFNYATGAQTSNPNIRVYYIDTMLRSRTRPTAYVLPKGEAWEEKVLSLAALHGISYTELEPGAAVKLQQYGGTVQEATLSDEKTVTFATGAYVFTMDQKNAVILALLMEPDVTDANEGTASFVQSGVIGATDGTFPIYRYIHDLNEDGTIDFSMAPAVPEGLSVVHPAAEGQKGSIIGLDPTKKYEYRYETESSFRAVPDGASEIGGLWSGKYYVRLMAGEDGISGMEKELEIIDSHITSYQIYLNPISGNDAENGKTEAGAVKTVQMAYDRLTILMRYAPEGQVGTIVLCDTLSLPASGSVTAFQFPSHSYPVILKGISDSTAIRSNMDLYFYGETTLEHLTVSLTQNLFRFVLANGHRFTVGEGVTTTKTTNYYGIAGGANTEAVASTDLTITSGIWRNAYAGGYKGNVTGDAHLTILGGEIGGVAQNSYSGMTGGNVTITVRNAKIGANPLYAANANSNDIYGDLTYILGEGAQVNEMYAGSRDAGNVRGTARVIADGAEITAPLHGKALRNGTVGASELILRGGTFAAQASDFSKVILDTSAGGTVTVQDDLLVNEVIGGGKLILPTGKKLTVQAAVSGTTEIALTEKTTEEITVVQAPAGTSANAFVLADVAYGTKSEADSVLWIINSSDVPKISFYGASITLQENLQVNFYVEKASLPANAELTATISFCGESVSVTEWEEEGEYLVYHFSDVAPQKMNDIFTATLAAVTDGVTTVSDPISYSVAQYCYNQLARTEDPELRTLLVDLLHYGAAAQRYTDYETASPADAALTEEQLLWGTSVEEDLALQTAFNKAISTVADPKADFTGATLYLEDAITMQFYFKASSIEGMTARITDENGALLAEIPYTEFVDSESEYGWQVSFRGMNADQMKDKVQITLIKDKKAVSDTLQYSIESYIYAKQDSEYPYLAELCLAMMRYGNAAYAYAN